MQENDRRSPGFTDLGELKIDVDRPRRTGAAEAVFAAGKTPDQVVRALTELRNAHPELPALATRCEPACLEAVKAAFDGVTVAETLAVVGDFPEPSLGTVGVVCAGTSDLPVAHEALYTSRALAMETHLIADVGVAGIHRLLAQEERLRSFSVLVVVAGMEGALPSVVAGLTDRPLIAVPTSVGYGASFGGLSALLTMLNSCAPGITTVNIDNGFGAAQAALRMLRLTDQTKD
ncbi:nickel pincer cofactor biosynthesis protein LarB [Salininema proteolyticum]|uniref:Nickel pincer cofactor biosynthesis protein LarB n=1 Tax=Salininema proteolyticum TaxID=1607685 RepID=A0ABV8TT57_9ACTN